MSLIYPGVGHELWKAIWYPGCLKVNKKCFQSFTIKSPTVNLTDTEDRLLYIGKQLTQLLWGVGPNRLQYNRQLERRRLADHLWASTLPLAGKQVKGVAPLVQTEQRFQSLWREGWKVDRSTTSNVFLPLREGEGKQRHRCCETVVISGNCTVISQLRVIHCLNSPTARFRVYATDHSNRCHIYKDISEQLICSYPQLIVASSTLLPPPTWGSWETLWLRERQYVTLEHMSTPGASWETDGGAVQQERLNARTVCDRSVSPCRLTVTSGVQRRTHKLIHTEDAQTKQACTDTVWQLRHRCGLLPSSVPLERRWWSCAVERRGSKCQEPTTYEQQIIWSLLAPFTLAPLCSKTLFVKTELKSNKKEQIVWGLLILTFKKENGASLIHTLCCKSLFQLSLVSLFFSLRCPPAALPQLSWIYRVSLWTNSSIWC